MTLSLVRSIGFLICMVPSLVACDIGPVDELTTVQMALTDESSDEGSLLAPTDEEKTKVKKAKPSKEKTDKEYGKTKLAKDKGNDGPSSGDFPGADID